MGHLKCDHIKRQITLTIDYIKRLCLLFNNKNLYPDASGSTGFSDSGIKRSLLKSFDVSMKADIVEDIFVSQWFCLTLFTQFFGYSQCLSCHHNFVGIFSFRYFFCVPRTFCRNLLFSRLFTLLNFTYINLYKFHKYNECHLYINYKLYYQEKSLFESDFKHGTHIFCAKFSFEDFTMTVLSRQ